MKVCGESSDVQGKTIDSWKERLPEILEVMRLAYFGRCYLIAALGAKESSIGEERRVNNG